MNNDKVEFPAVLVLARYNHQDQKVIAFVDDRKILESDRDLENRLAFYRRLEDMGALPYTYTLASLGDAEQVKTKRVVRLEFEHGLRESPEV